MLGTGCRFGEAAGLITGGILGGLLLPVIAERLALRGRKDMLIKLAMIAAPAATLCRLAS